MGGSGSGRWKYASTPTVEDCRHLDVDHLKEFTKLPGARGPVWWGDRANPEASITVVAEDDRAVDGDARAATLRFKYTVTDPSTGESEEYDYSVPLEYTDCNFGGVRPWFRCPGVVDGEQCGRRVRKLYLPHSRGAHYYLCRECYDLGYTSSRTSGNEVKQAELRYRRAFAKADAENRRPHPASMEAATPERPTGMHHDTCKALLVDIEQARRDWYETFHAELRSMAGDLDGQP